LAHSTPRAGLTTARRTSADSRSARNGCAAMSSSGSKTSTKPISRLGRAHIKDIIGAKASTPEAANNLLKVLRVLLSHAVEIGMTASNPAIGVKRYRRHGDGIHTWTEAEVAQFETSHPIGRRRGSRSNCCSVPASDAATS